MATAREAVRDGRGSTSTAERPALGTPVLLALVWLSGASAFLLLYWGSKLTFLFGDWDFLVNRSGFDAHAILDPHGAQIVILPVLAYKALLATFGMSSALPFRAISTVLFLLGALLLFGYLRKRVGQWPALAATAVVILLGAAWEDLLWPFQIGYFGAVACGLGALLAIERPDRRGDPLACLLLGAAVLFSTVGLAFAVGTAVAILLGSRRGERLYVFVVPLALFAVWWAGWGRGIDTHLSLTHAAQTPLYLLNGVAAAVASLLGLAETGKTAGGLEWGRPLSVALVSLGAWRIYRLGGVPRGLWPPLAIAASFWIVAGLNQVPGQEATISRYQYPGTIFVLLIAAELLRGVRIKRPAVLAVSSVVVAGAIVANVHQLHLAYLENYRPASQLVKGSLGAVEIARDRVEPTFRLSPALIGDDLVDVEAGPYLSAADAHGSPAYDPAELAVASENARFVADKVLFSALGVALEPLPGATRPAVAAATAGDGGRIVVRGRGCVEAPTRGGETSLLVLPRDGATVFAGPRPVEAIQLRRFATGPRVPIELTEEIAAGGAAALPIPTDRSTVPWKARVKSGGPVTVCGAARGSISSGHS